MPNLASYKKIGPNKKTYVRTHGYKKGASGTKFYHFIGEIPTGMSLYRDIANEGACITTYVYQHVAPREENCQHENHLAMNWPKAELAEAYGLDSLKKNTPKKKQI